MSQLTVDLAVKIKSAEYCARQKATVGTLGFPSISAEDLQHPEPGSLVARWPRIGRTPTTEEIDR
jgi:hypothetical protein